MKDQPEQSNSFAWIELAAMLSNGRMVRGKFVRADDRSALDYWRRKFNNTDIYASVFRYEKPDAQSRFIGPVFADIDFKDDLSQARKSALIFCQLLFIRMKLEPDEIEIYFSGSKGFHIIVPCEVFDPQPWPLMLKLYKKMAYNARCQGVEFIDAGVYTKRRLLRLVNSLHGKSRLYKIPLYHKELMHLRTDKLLEMAKQPRDENIFIEPPRNKKAAQWYRYALKCIGNIKTKAVKTGDNGTCGFKRGWRIPPCIKALQASTLADGTRHQAYLCLARFYSWINMHPEEITERLNLIDSKNPINDHDSIDRIVKWSAKCPGFAGCDNEILKKYCKQYHCFYYRKFKETQK